MSYCKRRFFLLIVKSIFSSISPLATSSRSNLLVHGLSPSLSKSFSVNLAQPRKSERGNNDNIIIIIRHCSNSWRPSWQSTLSPLPEGSDHDIGLPFGEKRSLSNTVTSRESLLRSYTANFIYTKRYAMIALQENFKTTLTQLARGVFSLLD